MLIDTAWLPSLDGNMHRPSDLILDDLLVSFVRDEKLAPQLGMNMDDVLKLAEKAGVKIEFIEFAKNNLLEVQQLIEKSTVSNVKPAFPVKSVTNPDRRREKLTKRHDDSPEKEYEHRDRRVRTTRAAVDPNLWLKKIIQMILIK
jgi:hypothetical protein